MIFKRDRAKKDKAPGKPRLRSETDGFDPETHYAMIRSSICTGEKVAGFRDRRTGRFTEIMLIRSNKDLDEFKRIYGVDELPVEY